MKQACSGRTLKAHPPEILLATKGATLKKKDPRKKGKNGSRGFFVTSGGKNGGCQQALH